MDRPSLLGKATSLQRGRPRPWGTEDGRKEAIPKSQGTWPALMQLCQRGSTQKKKKLCQRGLAVGSAAVVARNDNGVFLGASAVVMLGITNLEQVEAVACQEGLSLASDLGIQSFTLACK
jgi:hypothetical protein